MNKVQKLEFELDEADRLIAAFGHQTDKDDRQSLEEYLRSQKTRFEELELSRAQARSGPAREH